MGRPVKHDAETRQMLLAAACRLLGDQGPQAVSLRSLVAEVDLSTRAVYSVFGSKEGLVRAMYQQGFRDLDEELAVVAEVEPTAQILGLALAYRRSALRSPELFRVMFLSPFPEFVRDATDRELGQKTLQRLRDAVQEAHAQGSFNQGQGSEAMTVHLWSIMHGFVVLELNGEFDHIEPGPEHVRSAVEAFLAASAARAS